MILAIWGEDKTCKTTLALTFPKPLIHMEFDVGGFDRAKHRFIEDITKGLIIHEIYPMPLQVISLDKIAIRPSKIILGVKELWYKFLIGYIQHLNDDKVKTIVIDTGTLLWEICCTGFLQEKQEIQLDPKGNLLPGEKGLRVSLLPIEYREPNIRMRGIIYQAKAHNKHLVLTHHSRDEYAPMPGKGGEIVEGRTGKKERSGWTPLGDGADMIVHTFIKQEPIIKDGQQVMNGKKPVIKVIPYCNVELSEVLELAGMEFKEPNFDIISKAISFIKGS